ncbi:MAG: carboxylating nicotinate-nucleotide diphosphorylase [Verrucomicrobiota bacterium]
MVKTQLQAQQLIRRLRWDELEEACLIQLIGLARDEDVKGTGLAKAPPAAGDLTSGLLPSDLHGSAELVARESLIACGLPLVPLILNSYAAAVSFTPTVEDGAVVKAGDTFGLLEGRVVPMLSLERVMLNFIQHLSGVATTTRAYVSLLEETGIRLLDPRKTTPGLRLLEKYAVACGGGYNHRLGLYDRIMLKDNHLEATGDALSELVQRARKDHPDVLIEIEVDALEDVRRALDAGADLLLLDNFTPEEVAQALTLIADRAWVEVSGGISRQNLADFAMPGLDFISTGALVHQSRWVDIGLDWKA